MVPPQEGQGWEGVEAVEEDEEEGEVNEDDCDNDDEEKEVEAEAEEEQEEEEQEGGTMVLELIRMLQIRGSTFRI